jgi:uncharacterized membrane protein YjdF
MAKKIPKITIFLSFSYSEKKFQVAKIPHQKMHHLTCLHKVGNHECFDILAIAVVNQLQSQWW